MTIVTQNQVAMINYDNVNSIDVQGSYIRAYVTGEQPICLAHYSTDERAKSEFSRLIDGASCKQGVIYLAEA